MSFRLGMMNSSGCTSSRVPVSMNEGKGKKKGKKDVDKDG